MKKILSALFALCLLLPASYGQDNEIRPKALGISFFLNDFVSANRIRTTSLSSVLNNKSMAKIREMSPGLAINYFNGITKHIDFAGTLGGSFFRYPMTSRSFASEKLLLEATASVNIKTTTEKYWVQPYLSLGVGGHKYGPYLGAFLPMGVGLKVNVLDEAHLFITSSYRVPVTTETANYHLQHAIGIAGRLGKKKEPVKIIEPPKPPVDTDGDGIIDSLDKCPRVKGVPKYQGCPVPDTDKDGINDDDDKCPTVPGLARYQGCPIPDTDKDGINDEEDKCPTVPGLARYQGCPIPDTDGDGVNDEVDRCPTLKGVPENYGCPIIPDSIRKRIDVAAKNILFVTGSAKLQSKSFKGLNDVASIMAANPEMKLTIEGHTDNVGKDEYNQKLSEDRAASVRAYIISKGVDASRITSAGFGETRPIATNNTAAGRQQNRRVEMKMVYYIMEVKQ